MPTFLDIETTANTDLLHFLPAIAPPGSYKKPESIAQWHAENGESARQEQVARMPLDPLLFRLRAISLAAGPLAQPEVWLIQDEAEEEATLQRLWLRLADSNAYPLVGYNILGFDLPRLLWRSAMLGLRPARPLDLRRYGGGDALDLMLLLKNFDVRTTSLSGMGLKTVCAILGIPNPLPGLDGSMVATMSDEELTVYAANDIRLTQQLYRRLVNIYFRDFDSPMEAAF